MRPALRLLSRLDRFRGRPDEWDDRQRARLRRARVPSGRLAGLLARPFVEAVFGTPNRRATVDETTVPGTDGPLPARVHRPGDLTDDAPLVVHFHGGGWTFGSAVQYDWWCSQLAVGLGAVVVSLDYRLAPEHPAPAAVHDAVTATTWLLDHAGERFGATGPAAVTGDSAGANLATLVALDRRDAGDARLRAQWLVCPIVDLTCSAPSFDRLADAPFLDRAELDVTIAGYLDGVAPEDPLVSPWFVADVSDVAPALVQVAQHDLLYDDGVRWADRLADAGVDVALTSWVDQPHVFTLLPGVTPAARAALAEGVAFLAARLVADDTTSTAVPGPGADTRPPTKAPRRVRRSRHPHVPDDWIRGDVEPGFGAVADAFVANFADRDEIGAALTVVRDGRAIVDLWGGHADRERTRHWQPDTMVPVFSTTKGMETMATAVAHSRGWLDFDEPVATYWPAFAANGKEAITVRQLLSHQAGLAALDEPLGFEALDDPDEVAARLAAQAPLWEPGTRQGYHAVTIGFYEGELLRRADPAGRSVGRLFAEEVAAPLGGLDFHIGVPEDLPDERLATFLHVPMAQGLLHLGEHRVAAHGRPAAPRQPHGPLLLRRADRREHGGDQRPGPAAARTAGVRWGRQRAGGRGRVRRTGIRRGPAGPGARDAGGVRGTGPRHAGRGSRPRVGVRPAVLDGLRQTLVGVGPGLVGPQLRVRRRRGVVRVRRSGPGAGLRLRHEPDGLRHPTDPREAALRRALYECLGGRPQS